MFSVPGKNSASFLAIGERNIETTKKMLEQYGIPLVASDVVAIKGVALSFTLIIG